MLVVAGCAGMPENMSAPTLPKAVQVPAGHRHALTLKASGTLNYECRALAGMSGAYAWTLDAPDASLLHWSGLPVGRYYAGPTLALRDGSRIVTAVIAASPDEPGKLPIQLLKTVSASGPGDLAGVTFVQRLNAVGAPPDGRCGPADVGKASRVGFSADFLFYKKR
jgi:hypothetical protein